MQNTTDSAVLADDGSDNETNASLDGLTALIYSLNGAAFIVAIVVFIMMLSLVKRRLAAYSDQRERLKDDFFAYALACALNLHLEEDQVAPFQTMATQIVSAIAYQFGVDVNQLTEQQRIDLVQLVARYFLRNGLDIPLKRDWLCGRISETYRLLGHLLSRIIYANWNTLRRIFSDSGAPEQPPATLAYQMTIRVQDQASQQDAIQAFVKGVYPHLWAQDSDQMPDFLRRFNTDVSCLRTALWWMHTSKVSSVDSFNGIIGFNPSEAITFNKVMSKALGTLAIHFPIYADLLDMLAYVHAPMPTQTLHDCFEAIIVAYIKQSLCSRRLYITMEDALHLFQHCGWVVITESGVNLTPAVHAAYVGFRRHRQSECAKALLAKTHTVLFETLTAKMQRMLRAGKADDAAMVYCNHVFGQIDASSQQSPSAVQLKFRTTLSQLTEQQNAVSQDAIVVTMGEAESPSHTPPSDAEDDALQSDGKRKRGRSRRRTGPTARVQPVDRRNLSSAFDNASADASDQGVQAGHTASNSRKRCVL